MLPLITVDCISDLEFAALMPVWVTATTLPRAIVPFVTKDFDADKLLFAVMDASSIQFVCASCLAVLLTVLQIVLL